MSIFFAPHIVSVQQATETINPSDLAVYRPSYPFIATDIPCYIYPMSQAVSYEKYAISLKRPNELMCDTQFRGIFLVGNWVRWNERLFVVSSPVQVYEAGGDFTSIDCCQVALEELQFINASDYR